jgi:Ala-tRNA(Pro) deacylase
MRIPDFLAEQQVDFESLLHPPAFTAQKRAKYLRVSGTRVAKSVLLEGPRGAFLAVLPATHRVDTEARARDLEGPVRLATAGEVAEVFRDCEWGVVSPFGSLYGLPTLLDEELNPGEWIVFEGHSHMHALRMLCRDFERLEQPRRLRFARRTSPPA